MWSSLLFVGFFVARTSLCYIVVNTAKTVDYYSTDETWNECSPVSYRDDSVDISKLHSQDQWQDETIDVFVDHSHLFATFPQRFRQLSVSYHIHWSNVPQSIRTNVVTTRCDNIKWDHAGLTSYITHDKEDIRFRVQANIQNVLYMWFDKIRRIIPTKIFQGSTVRTINETARPDNVLHVNIHVKWLHGFKTPIVRLNRTAANEIEYVIDVPAHTPTYKRIIWSYFWVERNDAHVECAVSPALQNYYFALWYDRPDIRGVWYSFDRYLSVNLLNLFGMYRLQPVRTAPVQSLMDKCSSHTSISPMDFDTQTALDILLGRGFQRISKENSLLSTKTTSEQTTTMKNFIKKNAAWRLIVSHFNIAVRSVRREMKYIWNVLQKRTIS